MALPLPRRDTPSREGPYPVMVLPNGKPTLSASSNFLEEPSPEDKTLPKAWGWLPEPSREMLRAWRCARLPTRLCIELCTSGGGVPCAKDQQVSA